MVDPETNPETNPDANPDTNQGNVDYAHYLWHLAAIGMFDHIENPSLVREPPTLKGQTKGELKKEFSLTKNLLNSKIWSRLKYTFDEKNKLLAPDGYSTTVAILGTGIYPHIGFTNNIDHFVDFSTNGKVTYSINKKLESKILENVISSKSEIVKKDVEESFASAKKKVEDEGWTIDDFLELEDEQVIEKIFESEDLNNCAHGTALAGLVSGYHEYKVGQTDNEMQTMLYTGVDPSAKLISITTSFAPDPFQLIHAILYAAQVADVILFARDIPDPIRAYVQKDAQKDIGHGAIPETENNPDEYLWNILKSVIEEVAGTTPFVCASGNEGKNMLLYPASLGLSDDSNVISVGAVTYDGYRSGYSNYGKGLTVVAPSGDSEVINKHQIRLGPEENYEHDYDIYKAPNILRLNMSNANIITTDIPGKLGYVDKSNKLFGQDSLTEFSGTSSAAAIVAGVISLYKRTLNIENSTAEWNGASAKRWLEGNADIDANIGTNKGMTPDNCNIDEADISNKEYWFGKGLVQVGVLFEPKKLESISGPNDDQADAKTQGEVKKPAEEQHSIEEPEPAIP